MLAVTVSWCYIITWEWRFRMHFIDAEDFSLSTKSNLMHIAPWSEDDIWQLLNCGQWFLFLKETKWLSFLENHNNQPQKDSHGISNPFPCSRHAVSRIGFSSVYVPMRRTLFFESDHAKMSGHFSVWIMSTENCRDVLRSAETFQLLTQFSCFILEFFVLFFVSSQSIFHARF